MSIQQAILLVDGIYPQLCHFVKTITDDQSRATKQEQANLCAVTVLCASTYCANVTGWSSVGVTVG